MEILRTYETTQRGDGSIEKTVGEPAIIQGAVMREVRVNRRGRASSPVSKFLGASGDQVVER